MGSIKENLTVILDRIVETAHGCGRNPEDIELIAVTKTVSAERINEGIAAGIEIIGENKVQETQSKIDQLKPVILHMIGHLQTNKVKYAVKIFDMIQSVDSLKLAKEVDKRCQSLDIIMPVLIEVNTSGEESKFGCQPEIADSLVEKISQLPHLRIEGLMTIGLFTDDMSRVRPCFIRLRKLAEQIKRMNLNNVKMNHLSMGMTADFPVAIEEGATMLRLGTAIFGPRSYSG
jgi:pyridoxal phosphate enzyme (YggS family)